MADKIKVMIVDDLATTRESVRKLLNFEPNVELVGEAANGRQAIESARNLRPDIILMDINMPDMDGISASQQIVNTVPGTQIIMMSVQSETDYIRRAMVAGARDFLTKPFSLDELLTAIHNAFERKQTMPVAPVAVAPRPATPGAPAQEIEPAAEEGGTIAVYSPKGGVGCTTVAVNLAVSLARQKYRTVLVDASLQFGDVAVMLNLKPMATIVELLERTSELDPEFVESVVSAHKSGLRVLIGPPRPEMAEMVRVEHMETLVNYLRQLFTFVVIDTGSKLDDMNLALLDLADRILLVTQQELPGIKNASRFLDLASELEYPREKVILVVNRVMDKQGISPMDVANALKRPAPLTIPAADRLARQAANQGTPLVLSGRRDPAVQSLGQLTRRVLKEFEAAPEEAETGGRPSFLRRLFGRS